MDAADRPLRVLAVTNMWPEDGGYRGLFVRQAMGAVSGLGHEVDVELVAQSRGRLDYLKAGRRIRRRVRDRPYDIVHVHFGMTGLACRITRPPRVLTLYGSDINTPWKRWVTKLGWTGVAARIYVSRRLAEAAGDPDGHVIPNGIDVAHFQPLDRLEARARLGLDDEGLIVLFGGDPRRAQKGFDLFDRAVDGLRRSGVPARQLILSEPRQPIDRVVLKMAAADLLLFTSRRGSEGSPTVVKEAVAMGLPVVTVDVGDVGEILADVSPSAVVPYGRDLASAGLASTLADRARTILEQGVRSNGPALASRLSLETAARRTIEVYLEVLGR